MVFLINQKTGFCQTIFSKLRIIYAIFEILGHTKPIIQIHSNFDWIFTPIFDHFSQTFGKNEWGGGKAKIKNCKAKIFTFPRKSQKGVLLLTNVNMVITTFQIKLKYWTVLSKLLDNNFPVFEFKPVFAHVFIQNT